jgi:hypothetical protein
MGKIIITCITIVMILTSCNSKAKKVKKLQDPSKFMKEIEKTTSDTIRILSGFYLGMPEAHLLEYVKNNTNKFFINQNQILKFLHTKINNIDYSIDFSLYKGNLFSSIFMCNNSWPQVDDIGLKENYNRVYNLVKGLYKNRHISNPYYDKFKVDWPYSLGSNDRLTMAKIQDPGLEVSLDICNDPNGGYSFDISFRYIDYSIHESTLEKELYFDNL